jgi:23S rRNA pseudouridine2457 synthase
MPVYILFHKPYQVLTQFSAEGDKKTLADFLPGIPANIYPVGRLDYDSEGLLLLTDDKSITHHLLDPLFAHPRTYWVQVEGILINNAIDQLNKGVTISIDGKKYITKRADARIMDNPPKVAERTPPIRFRKNVPDSWLSLTIKEGKNRQVRRMTAAVGYPTLRLIRYAIGSITLDGLKPGEHRFADPQEIQKIIQSSMSKKPGRP